MRRLCLIFVLVGLIFTSCDKEKSSGKATLRANFLAAPSTLDPRKTRDMTSSTTLFMLFEGLTKSTPESNQTPALAERIEISDDMRIYTFYLREARWSNGDLITSYDFEHTWKSMLDPVFPSPNANLLYSIKNAFEAKQGEVSVDRVGILCPDAQTLVVELNSPVPYFLDLTSFCGLFPTHEPTVKEHSDWADNAGPHFVTNGPYRLKKNAIGDEMVLEKNPHYWNKDQVKLDKIQVSYVDNETTALDLFEKGKLDIIGMPFTNIPVDSINHLDKSGRLQKKEIAGTTSFYFNTSRFPFTNTHVRKAFGLGISRKNLIDSITQLGDVPGVDNLPPITKPGGKVTGFIRDNDIEGARAHFKKGLEEIGIAQEKFPEVTLLYSATDYNKKIAQVLQEMWHTNLGIKVNLEVLDFKIFLDRVYSKQYDFAIGKWVFQFNDMMNVLERYREKKEARNHTCWENPRYTDLLAQSMLAKTKEERFIKLEQAESILLDEMPTVALYHMRNPMMFNPKLKGVYVSPVGSVHLENAYFE